MKYKGPMLVVKDIEKTKAFYTRILQVRIISDLGENVTITGGLSFQSEDSWISFAGSKKEDFRYQGNVMEAYFEEEDFDAFMKRIEKEDIEFLGGVSTMPWGQKVIRFYDPDKHIIQIGEDLSVMMKRMYQNGMSVDEIAEKTFMKKGIIERMLKI